MMLVKIVLSFIILLAIFYIISRIIRNKKETIINNSGHGRCLCDDEMKFDEVVDLNDDCVLIRKYEYGKMIKPYKTSSKFQLKYHSYNIPDFDDVCSSEHISIICKIYKETRSGDYIHQWKIYIDEFVDVSVIADITNKINMYYY